MDGVHHRGESVERQEKEREQDVPQKRSASKPYVPMGALVLTIRLTVPGYSSEARRKAKVYIGRFQF